jgi:hypothetical protein
VRRYESVDSSVGAPVSFGGELHIFCLSVCKRFLKKKRNPKNSRPINISQEPGVKGVMSARRPRTISRTPNDFFHLDFFILSNIISSVRHSYGCGQIFSIPVTGRESKILPHAVGKKAVCGIIFYRDMFIRPVGFLYKRDANNETIYRF